MKLARLANATVDSSADNMGRGNLFALQKRGRVTATLGEIKNRSELVVFWFCDPIVDHPDFFDSYIGNNCHTVVVNPTKNETAQIASQFIELEPDQSVSAIWSLRAAITESQIATPNLAPSEILELASRLKSSQYGAIIWGSEHCDPEFDVQADGIHAMVRELNQHTPFVGIPYRRDGNGLSAENVSTWNSGFPFAVNWNRTSPRQHWLEYSDSAVSENDEWDFLISMEVGEFTVACQPMQGQGAFQITLPVSEFGMSESGDACRFDDVAISLDATEKTESPTTQEILEAIGESFSSTISPSS